MRKALDRVKSSQSRISSAKMLTEMLERLIKLEREAYGINVAVVETVDAPGSLAALIAGMKRSALPIVVDVSSDDSL